MPGNSTVIASRLANALIKGAEPAELATRFAGIGGRLVFELAKRGYGGLWVSGRITLTDRELTFVPNFLNRMAHETLHAVTIPLPRIVSVTDRFGLVTRIVDVALDEGSTFTFRCIAARAFAAGIAAAANAAPR
jgi:hypothetical protein